MTDTPNPNAFLETMAQATTVPTHGRMVAMHIGETDLPFVSLGDGTHLQVQQIDLSQGLWVVRTKFDPGVTIPKHFHTGPVYAVTLEGSWYYKEYPDVVNSKGSYLFEPAGSVHTLTVPADQDYQTDVWFAIFGSNVNIDDDGNVVSMIEAGGVLDVYRTLCAAQGHPNPKTIVFGEQQAA